MSLEQLVRSLVDKCNVGSREDILVLTVWSLLARRLGKGYEEMKAPEGWELREHGVFDLKWDNVQVKAVLMENLMVLHGIDSKTEKSASVEIPIDDFMRVDPENLTEFQDIWKDISGFTTVIETQLLDKILPEPEEKIIEQFIGIPPPNERVLERFTGDNYPPMRGDFDQDLNPIPRFAGPSGIGGNLMGPNHPIFQGPFGAQGREIRPGRGRGRGRGGQPRFDPFNPNGGAFGFGDPDPDGFGPPGRNPFGF